MTVKHKKHSFLYKSETVYIMFLAVGIKFDVRYKNADVRKMIFYDTT